MKTENLVRYYEKQLKNDLDYELIKSRIEKGAAYFKGKDLLNLNEKDKKNWQHLEAMGVAVMNYEIENGTFELLKS